MKKTRMFDDVVIWHDTIEWIMKREVDLKIRKQNICNLPHRKTEKSCVFCEALSWRELIKKIQKELK